MSVTLREIAESTGYTEATVSNAINNRGRMSEQTRRTIIERAREMGYSPNNSARSLAARRSGEIGVVIPNIDNPFYSRMVSKITMLCREAGYESIFADSYESMETEIEAVSRMVSRRVEGLLIAPVNHNISLADYLPMLERNHIKYMFISNCLPGRGVPYVMTDLRRGAEIVTGHLLESGRRKLALFVGQDENPVSSHRLDGYRAAFERYGVDFGQAVQIVCGSYNYEEGYRKTKELLCSGKEIDAVIAINDFMAAGAETALSEGSVRIPDDIAIAGYDDLFFSKMLLSPLTTVRQDIDRMSRIGVGRLIFMIESDTQTEEEILLLPELIVRESTVGRAAGAASAEPVSVRRYRAEDAPALAKLFYETVHSVCLGDYTEEQADAWAPAVPDPEKWGRSFEEHYTVVAVCGGVPVGFGDIDDTGYLDRLYVDKCHQRQGAATAICDELERSAGGDITVHASITARPFFEKRGYKVQKEQQVSRNGVLLTNFVMKKER